MRYVAPIRKELGIKTFFNILGPILNPARVNIQLTGVSDLKTFELYKGLFSKLNGLFGVVHSFHGYDEISLTGDFRVATRNIDEVFSPNQLEMNKVSPTA